MGVSFRVKDFPPFAFAAFNSIHRDEVSVQKSSLEAKSSGKKNKNISKS